MEKKKSLGKNFVYNLIYQIFLLIVPFIVTPYVSRVLLPEGIGKYSFSYSIVQYFVILGVLGFGYYAQREVAKCNGDKKKQSIVFWEINICRLVSTLFSLTIYFILIFLGVFKQYTELMIIMSFNIVSTIFDEAFLFQGNEDFGKIVIRNVLVKIIGVFSVFVFVKNSNDLYIYTIIQTSIVLITNVSLILYLPKYLCKVKFNELNPIRHAIPTLRLFIPQIATTIYSLLDKSIIGFITQNDSEVGFYEQVEKLIRMSCVFVTCIGTVMIPRNSVEFKNNNIEKMKDNLYVSIRFVWMLGIPISLGLICVANRFIPLYLGDGYEKCILLLRCFSAFTIIMGLTNAIGLIWMVPQGMDRKYTLSCVIGAAVNLVLTITFVFWLQSLGAVIASIIAEVVILFTMILMCKKDINIKNIFISSWKYVISGILMLSFAFALNYTLPSSTIFMFVIIVCGAAIYFVVLISLRDSLTLKIVNLIFLKMSSFFCKKGKR